MWFSVVITLTHEVLGIGTFSFAFSFFLGAETEAAEEVEAPANPAEGFAGAMSEEDGGKGGIEPGIITPGRGRVYVDCLVALLK